jgi:DNA-binding GntR family transcriptional regulator
MRWTVDPGAALPLREQIASSVRRALAAGEVVVGDVLPPAAELGEALGVDRNTVLAAYRHLRDEGVLEFRRGRGVRVARADRPHDAVLEAAERLVAVGRRHRLDREALVRVLRELP